MYCKNCGFKMNDGDSFCTNCGYQNYGNSAISNMYNNKTTEKQDNANVGLVILSILFPIVGLILFLSTKNDTPKAAKSYGIGALVSSILRLVILIICIICAFYAYKYATKEYINNNWNEFLFDDEDIEYFDYAVSNYVKLASGKFYQDIYSDKEITSKCYDIDELEQSDYYDGSIEVSLIDGKTHFIIWLTDYEYFISGIDYEEYNKSMIQYGSHVERSCIEEKGHNSL